VIKKFQKIKVGDKVVYSSNVYGLKYGAVRSINKENKTVEVEDVTTREIKICHLESLRKRYGRLNLSKVII